MADKERYMYMIDENIQEYSDDIDKYVEAIQESLKEFIKELKKICECAIYKGAYHEKLEELTSVLERKVLRELEKCKLNSDNGNLTNEFINNVDKEDQALY